MLAHALALHLALLDPLAAPEVHVLPPLALAAPLPALAQGEPAPPAEATAPPARAEGARARRGSVSAGYVGGLVGTVAADLLFGGMFVLGIVNTYSGLFDYGDPSGGWLALAMAGAIGFTFVTPVATVVGAQRAEGHERPGLAYAAVFAVRLGGFLAAGVFPPIALVTELVLAPLTAAAVVSRGRPFGHEAASPPPDFPDEPAPRPDAGQAGATLSRPLCPDAAFALR